MLQGLCGSQVQLFCPHKKFQTNERRNNVTLRKIATSVGVVLAATATMAHADVNSQLASLQSQVNQLQSQVNSSSNSSSMGNLVGVNSNLSWKMMSNYSGVGKEMNLLKARQAGNLSCQWICYYFPRLLSCIR